MFKHATKWIINAFFCSSLSLRLLLITVLQFGSFSVKIMLTYSEKFKFLKRLKFSST